MKCVDTFINEYKQDGNIQDYPIRIKGSKSLEVIQLEVTTLCSKVRHKQGRRGNSGNSHAPCLSGKCDKMSLLWRKRRVDYFCNSQLVQMEQVSV